MITLERPAYYSNDRYAEYNGLSTDDKATIKAYNADKFYEIDTGKTYRYNEASNEWIEQPDPTTAVDTGIPPMSSETAGHFLSNDGNVTQWQEFASADFIIELTEHQDNTYTANKTWAEIKNAFDAKENIAVSIGNGDTRLPLMVAEINENGDAGFTFGHTQVQTGGQRVVTRMVQYSHSGDDDMWTDGDGEADLSAYLQLAGGVMGGPLVLSGAPQDGSHAANKQYVDDRTLVVLFTTHEAAGVITSTTIEEITQSILAKKLVYATLEGDTYYVSAYSATDVSFSRVDASNKQVSTISYNPADGTWSKQTNAYLPITGGTMAGNIDMAAHNITNAQKIHIDGQANLYLGAVSEKAGTQGVRLTGVVGGGAAFVKPDKQAEYVTVSVGSPTAPEHAVNLGHLTQPILSDAPASDECLSNKKYVDDQIATRVPLQSANQGQIKAYVQNGDRPDVCLVSDGGMALCVARYTAKGHLIDQSAPTENNHLANKQYVDTKVAQTGGNISGNLMVGGSLTVNGVGSVLGTPTQDVDIVNKGYVDAALTDVVRKSSVGVGANSSVNVSLSNGAYLLTVSDDMHGGLVFVSVYPSGETINGLVNLNNWKCERVSSGSGVTLTNSATSAMTVYITSIGEGTYR